MKSEANKKKATMPVGSGDWLGGIIINLSLVWWRSIIKPLPNLQIETINARIKCFKLRN